MAFSVTGVATVSDVRDGATGAQGPRGPAGTNGANGADGANGDSFRTVYVFRNGTSLPSNPTSANFTASTGVAAAANGWSTTATVPPAGQTIYVGTVNIRQPNSTGNWVFISGLASPAASSGTNGANGAAGAPGANGADGSDAPRFAEATLYTNPAVASAPSAPSATITWSTGAISGITSGWSRTPPTQVATSNLNVYSSQLVFIDTTAPFTTTTATGSTPTQGTNFSGLVTFTGGDFAVDGSTITSIDGGNIQTGTIGASQIAAGAIQARQLSVAETGARLVVGEWNEGSATSPAAGSVFFSTSRTTLTRPANGQDWLAIQRIVIHDTDADGKRFDSIFDELVRPGSIFEFNQVDSNGLITRGAEFEVLAATFANDRLTINVTTQPTADIGTFQQGVTYVCDVAPNAINVLRVGDINTDTNARPTSGSGAYIDSAGDVTFGDTSQFVRWDSSAGELEIRGEIINFSPAFFNGNAGNWGQINTSQSDLSNVLDGEGFYVFAVIGNGGEGGGSFHSDNSNAGGSGGGGGGVAIVGYEWDGNTALACTISKDDGARGNNLPGGSRGGSFTFSEGGSTVLTITGAQAGGRANTSTGSGANNVGGDGGVVSGNWLNANHLINSYFQDGGTGGGAGGGSDGRNGHSRGGGGGAVDIGQVVQNNNNISNVNGLSGGFGFGSSFSSSVSSGGGASIWGPGHAGNSTTNVRRDGDNKTAGVNISSGANYFGIAPASIYGGRPRNGNNSQNGEAGGTFSGGSGASGSLYTNNVDNPARVAAGGNGGTWGGGGGGASAQGGSTADSGSYPGAIGAPNNNGGTGVILWYKL